MAAPRRCLVAVGQMTSTSSREANFAACASLAREASARGAAMLFLPECFHFIGGGSDGVKGADIAEPLDGPAMARYAALAKSRGLWLSLGGFQHRASPLEKPRNTHVVFDADGTLRASYDKLHLFDVDLPGQGVSLHESESTLAGDSTVVVRETPVGVLGLSVCYDIRFPSLYRALTLAGAQVLAIPAAFTVPTGAAHWEVLLRARAIESQCYVVAAAQIGRHNETRASFGHACIVDPWGTVIAQCADSPSPCLAVAEVDLRYLDEVRSRMPVAVHARSDAVYSSPARVE